MLKITLIRHGKTDGNITGKFISKTDEPLLKEEADALADLSFPKAQAVYCSPMKRCIETAKILFPYETAIIVPELKERDFGLFEGKTYNEISKDPKYLKWVDTKELLSYPEGEDILMFNERVNLGLEKIIKDAVENKKNDIAIVTHGGPIMSIMYEYGFP